MQGRALVVRQQLTGQGEAEGFPPADPYGGKIIRLVREPDGWYSNRARGDRAKAVAAAESAPSGPAPMTMAIMPDAAPSRKAARMRWAALIKKVYEADPLLYLRSHETSPLSTATVPRMGETNFLSAFRQPKKMFLAHFEDGPRLWR